MHPQDEGCTPPEDGGDRTDRLGLAALAARTGPLDLQRLVLDAGLCSLCGACTTLCPYIRANRHRAVVVESCRRTAGACYAVCPAAAVREVGWARDEAHPLGEVRAAYWARASDPAVRAAAQYGGTLSALLIDLLARSAASAALVAPPAANTPFPLVPEAAWATDRAGVLAAAGTRYVARPGAAAACARLSRPGERLAIAGRPCEIRGLESRLELRPLPGVVAIRIAVFCMWSLEHDALASALAGRVDPASVRRMEAGVEALEIESGGAQDAPGEPPRPIRIPMGEARRMARDSCRACPDFSGEGADVSVGSTERDPGWNSLLVRTAAGEAAVRDAIASGALEVRPFPDTHMEALRAAALGKKRRAAETLDALERRETR